MCIHTHVVLRAYGCLSVCMYACLYVGNESGYVYVYACVYPHMYIYIYLCCARKSGPGGSCSRAGNRPSPRPSSSWRTQPARGHRWQCSDVPDYARLAELTALLQGLPVASTRAKSRLLGALSMAPTNSFDNLIPQRLSTHCTVWLSLRKFRAEYPSFLEVFSEVLVL